MSQPYKTLLCIDFETRWSKADYTLSKMTTEAYIRDPRFKAFGVCIHEVGTDGVTQWYRHEELPRIFATYDWTKTAVVAQNTAFDAGILSFIYDVHPCFLFDTLSMARAMRGAEGGNSLAKLAEAYGLPPKGRAVHSTDGLDELSPEIEKELAEYCVHDVFLCESIFLKLMNGEQSDGAQTGPYPTKELRLIDMTLKMFTEPRLVLDVPMLEGALAEDTSKLAAALIRAGTDAAALGSNDKFAEVLRALGTEPPTKASPANKDKQIFAFAKSDALFQAMLNGDDEDVALLCEARLKVKSTQERTRAQRFIDIAGRGALPVPLYYYGAATGRYSAWGQINLQNMKRGSALRKAIQAPEGYVICAGDLSQIEPRVLAWLSDYAYMLEIFKAGGDPYATFGSTMFSIPDMTKESHPLLRQSAKSAMLGAGYQLGWSSFASQLLVGFLGAPPVRYTKADAKQLGVDAGMVQKFLAYGDNVKRMAEIPRTCTDAELLVHCMAAKAIIDKYRAAAEPVTNFWALLGSLIQSSLVDGRVYEHKGVLQFRKGEIEMVNGMCLQYRDIKVTQDEKGRPEYSFSTGKMRKKLYSGLVANNCIAEGTGVLTDRGWIPIEHVTCDMRVHDGIEFVIHSGLVANGVQGCGTVDGVYMTPEHAVLTDGGWKNASQVSEPFRPDIRHAHGHAPGGEHQGGVEVALPMRMRKAVREGRSGGYAGGEDGAFTKLRLRPDSAFVAGKTAAWDDETPRVHLLAQHAQSLSQGVGACIQKLWGAGHSGVQKVGRLLRELLGGHGPLIYYGAYAGAEGKQQRLHARQLPLGNAHPTNEQHPQNNTQRERVGTVRADGAKTHHDLLPIETRVARSSAGTAAFVRQQKQVYDILNCGPRSRFVVQGVGGAFIVHNCTQGLARIIMTDGMLRTAKRLPVVGTVHDEQLVLLPEANARDEAAWVKAQMVVVPKWMPGIPLNADVGYNKRYGLAKS